MKVAIVGSGAEGLGLASALLATGNDVHFVTRTASGAEALARAGLRRSGLFGERVFAPGLATASVDWTALPAFAPDWVLCCTKSPASPGVAGQLGRRWPDLSSTAGVVLCMNGWGHAEPFVAHLPAQRVYHARVITGFRRLAPHHVEVTAHAEPIHLGSLHGGPLEGLGALAGAIDGGGLPCAVSREIEADLLAKLLYNCALNPLGALLGLPYGALAESPHSRALISAVVHELFAVFAEAGLRTHWPDAEGYLETFYEALLPPTAAHESSMLQDIQAGRPTEVDALTGAVVALGVRHGVATPVAQALTQLVHAAEQRSPAD